MLLKSLSIGYNSSAPIVTHIDAELSIGRFVALIGRNGAGKSTLLQTLARLLPPLSGSIAGETPAIVLTQTPDLRNTTVRQMVAYGRLPYASLFGRLHPADWTAADDAIRLLDIQDLSARLFCALSDGERQKVMIARALAQGTDTLLLDEPSAFLDYPSRVQLMQTLGRLAHQHGKSILLSTHDIELAQRYTDELWLIRDHQLLTGLDPQATETASIF